MTTEHKPHQGRAGLHRKYYGLRRTRDDSEVEGWYFVLREDDRHSDAALAAYADSCEDEFPELAADLRQVVRDRGGSFVGASSQQNSYVETDKWYAGLDDGIRFAVRVLHAQGIETGQSCEGGEGHSYDRPTIDLLGHTPGAGFAAFAALTAYGLRVRDVAVLWSVDKDLLGENFWRITLWQTWPERADEKPMFVCRYTA